MIMRINSFSEMETMAKGIKQRVAVVCAQSTEILNAIDKASKQEIIEGILIGDEVAIRACLKTNRINDEAYQIINIKSPQDAAAKAVEMIVDNQADLLMKGKIETGDFYRAIFNEKKLKTDRRACSVVAIESKVADRIILLADVGVNISPSLEDKASIIASCIDMSQALGVEEPKVAVLASTDKVNPEKMPCTVDADQLTQMGLKGLFGQAIVEGPISMDIAVNQRAAQIKQYSGRIKGNADVLIAPDLNVGNILIKGLMFLSDDIQIAGVGTGTKIPTIITTRGDTEEGKYHSIIMSCLLSKSYMEG